MRHHKTICELTKKLHIVLFAYNFPHKKSWDFIQLLIENKVSIDLIIAADFVPLESISQINNKDMASHPFKLALKHGIPYKVAPHNSNNCIDLLVGFNINFGIISGARILHKNIINNIKYGVLNFHPAILPMVRGLDSVLWTINKGLPIGVTAHLINEEIDLGNLVCSDNISVSSDDNLDTMIEKNYQLQLKLIPIALNLIVESRSFPIIKGGDYNTKMTKEVRNKTIAKIKNYVEKYAKKN